MQDATVTAADCQCDLVPEQCLQHCNAYISETAAQGEQQLLSFGFGLSFARCARLISRRRFGSRCGSRNVGKF
jgi:hypothetical protein